MSRTVGDSHDSISEELINKCVPDMDACRTRPAALGPFVTRKIAALLPSKSNCVKGLLEHHVESLYPMPQ